LLKGILTLCDEMSLNQVCVSSRIIVLDEDRTDIVQMYNGVMGSILLPPYAAMCKEMDNDTNGFIQIYYDHLMSIQADQFITMICRALLNGVNLSIFIPLEQMSLKYPNVLLQYILNTFGIIVGTKDVPFMYNRSYDGIIMDKLYSHGLCSEEEFFQNIPISYNMYSMPTLNRLINVMNPYLENYTIESYMEYFNKYNLHVKSNNGKLPQIIIHKSR